MSDAYLTEIAEQPDAIRRLSRFLSEETANRITQIRQEIKSGRINHIILTGMGGSYYSAYGTWLRLNQHLDIPVSLWDASELIQQAPSLLRPGTMVVAISQSGESAELRRMAATDTGSSFRISITNGRHNSLASWAHFSFASEVGVEQTVSTKTYTAGMVMLYILETLLLGRHHDLAGEIAKVAKAIEGILASWQERIAPLTTFFNLDKPVMFIGRGGSYASAAMGALVMAEAAKAFTGALSGGQFRHGPLELVREDFQSILFIGQDNDTALNQKIIEDIIHLKGRCLVIAAQSVTIEKSAATLKILRIPDISQALLPILEIIPLQLFMVPFAKARGFKPAIFLNGTKVTTIE